MSYEVYFKPPVEEVEKFKPLHKKEGTFYTECTIDKMKSELLCYCMMPHIDVDIMSVINTLTLKLRLLKAYIEDDEKTYIYNEYQEKQEILFCGWQYAHSLSYTADEALNNTLETLLLYCKVIDTPDYFEKNDNFYEKRSNINEEIDGFVETMQECFIHEIIEKFEPYKKPEEDFDYLNEDTEIEQDQDVNNEQ